MHVGCVKPQLMKQNHNQSNKKEMIYQLFNMLSIFNIYSDLYFLIGLLLLIFLIVPYTILTLVVIWVYKDAKKKGLNAVVWVLIVWIIPFFIGVILYMNNRIRSDSDN